MPRTEEPLWSSLKKNWKNYKIYRSQGDVPKMKEYAKTINEIQEKLGLPKAKFTELKNVS